MAIEVNGLISGFDQARREYRDAEVKQAQAREDREYSLLQALATHMDPEIASVGATALLGLAGGAGPKLKKGLSGFLGEVEGSSTFGPIQQFLGAGSTNAAAVPGSAAQPDTALVEPEAIGAARTRAPEFGGAPAGPAVGGATPPTFGGGGADAAGAAAPPAFGEDVSAPQFGAPGMGGGIPQAPPAPETPQVRMRRLFPSAGDVAEETRFRELQGRFRAALDMIRQAKTPAERNIAFGLSGTPQRAPKLTSDNADFRTADGQELFGAVVFNPDSGEYTYDGEPVQILRLHPKTQARPIHRTTVGADGKIIDEYRDPNDLTGAPIAALPSGRTPPAGPPAYSGITDVDGGRFLVDPRGGALGPRLGDAPQRAGELTPEQAQAIGWGKEVNVEVQSVLDSKRVPGQPALKGLPAAQVNAIIKRITKGRYTSVNELEMATRRVAETGANTAPAADDPQARKTRIQQRLEQNRQRTQPPPSVQGAGLPPGM